MYFYTFFHSHVLLIQIIVTGTILLNKCIHYEEIGLSEPFFHSHVFLIQIPVTETTLLNGCTH